MVTDRRNFRKNPITLEELQDVRWYVVENDLIGGYSVATANKPESEHNVYEGDFTVGTFITKAMAQHIVDLHNSWLDRYVWGSYESNIIVASWGDDMSEGDWFHYDD